MSSHGETAGGSNKPPQCRDVRQHNRCHSGAVIWPPEDQPMGQDQGLLVNQLLFGEVATKAHKQR